MRPCHCVVSCGSVAVWALDIHLMVTRASVFDFHYVTIACDRAQWLNLLTLLEAHDTIDRSAPPPHITLNGVHSTETALPHAWGPQMIALPREHARSVGGGHTWHLDPP